MNSKIAQLIKLKNASVAVVKAYTPQAGELMFQSGKWGCVQSIRYAAGGGDTCWIGLTDPSARKCVDKETWEIISARI